MHRLTELAIAAPPVGAGEEGQRREKLHGDGDGGRSRKVQTGLPAVRRGGGGVHTRTRPKGMRGEGGAPSPRWRDQVGLLRGGA